MPIYRADRFALLHAVQPCWKCTRATRVVALLLPSDHTLLWEDDEEAPEAGECAVLLGNILKLNAEAEAVVRAHAPSLALVNSRTAELAYVGNRCGACRALQGDHYLRAPGAPFFPLDDASVEAIDGTIFCLPIEARADGGESAWMDGVWAALSAARNVAPE